MTGSSGKASEDRCAWEARVQVGWMQGGKSKKWALCVLKTGLRRDVRGNITTLQRRIMPTLRRSEQRRNVSESVTKQRRDVGYQRCDVLETAENPRRDVKISRRDVPEGLKINVATLEFHVATFQRRSKLTSRRWVSTSRRFREG